ncbi:hypothetical protein OEZ85_003398 [Tetradesmus obliquus]|uniref:Secreted protein n=1 Tax=Tetradesmus obliquus TaxID=3088 RepID=A0ABY8UE11_TETOB|nr:hypothetical protein OEZ85_003398 [Tetradesmus obliquus]
MLTRLLQVAASWAAVGNRAASGWCYLQLRRHLPAISAAGRDECLGLAQQRRLQALQFGVLQGSICMAARQGHQVCSVGQPLEHAAAAAGRYSARN